MGKESKKFNLYIRVEVHEALGPGLVEVREAPSPGLSVTECVSVSCTTFPEIAQILGQFHELAEAIKQARKGGS